MNRLPRFVLALAACGAVLGAAHTSHAQDGPPPHRPLFGIGAFGALTWPDMLALRASGRSEGFPLGLAVGGDLRVRLGNRFMVLGSAAASFWSSTSQLGELDPTFHTEPQTTSFLIVPIDLGFRVNVVPVPGPIAFYVGAGGRASIVSWATTASDLHQVIDRGTGFTVGVWPELAVEAMLHRRYSVELFARYAIGLLPGATGGPGQRFENAGAVGGLMLGLALHTYL